MVLIMELRQKLKILVLVVLWTALCAVAVPANAFVAYETSPGTVELRSKNDRGLMVKNVQTRSIGRSKKKWLYFCVSELTPARKISSQDKEKCFYGSPQQFKNIRVSQKFASIEYGLKNRLYNNKNLITIGTQRYFYPVYVMYELN